MQSYRRSDVYSCSFEFGMAVVENNICLEHVLRDATSYECEDTMAMCPNGVGEAHG
jgi:hypothetical protein